MSRQSALLELGARAVVAAAALGCLGLVVRLRAPVGKVPAAPPASSVASASPASSAGALGAAPSVASAAPGRGGVVLRLVDALSRATLDAPELAKVDGGLDYWRRMRSPYHAPPGELGRAVQNVSLVRERGAEHGRDLGGGVKWVPDERVWNMTEGTFDQRESIVAPPPATIRFAPWVVPAGAVLETAPAVMGGLHTGVRFEVAVHPAGSARVVLGTRVIEGKNPRAFEDWRLDLSRFVGQSVELELATRADHAVPFAPAAVWGSPNVIAPEARALPFNVLWIVVDALRADALASAHDPDTDRRMREAKLAPLDAWLPGLPEVAPNLDRLAERAALFTRAYSAATWTRPGTLAMLAASPSSSLGLAVLPLIPPPEQVRALYAARPSFLPLLLRPHGVVTRAVVNNFYLVGHAGVGIDVGFEGILDHRHELRDTALIAASTQQLLERYAQQRFFLFVNFNSPHVPLRPPKSHLDAIPEPPRGPAEKLLRAYLAEIRKDDAAIGSILEKLDQLGLRDDTLVIVTADHGETLSREHDAVPVGVDGGPAISGRFHHLSSLYEETARVPILIAWPRGIPVACKLRDPVSTIDIVPTVLELAGLERPPSLVGRSLVPALRGARSAERPILVEGRGAHSLQVGRWRLVVRDAEYVRVSTRGRNVERKLELYDLETDPGERAECSRAHPEVVERLLAMDRARASGGPVQDAPTAAASAVATLRLRFAGGRERHRVTGTLRAVAAAGPAKLSARPVGLGDAAIRDLSGEIRLDFETSDRELVGVDLAVEPPTADVAWQLALDGKPWPVERLFAGGLGLRDETLAGGVRGPELRRRIAAPRPAYVDPDRELGLFVTRDGGGEEIELGASGAATAEAMDVMRAWGYVR